MMGTGAGDGVEVGACAGTGDGDKAETGTGDGAAGRTGSLRSGTRSTLCSSFTGETVLLVLMSVPFGLRPRVSRC